MTHNPEYCNTSADIRARCLPVRKHRADNTKWKSCPCRHDTALWIVQNEADLYRRLSIHFENGRAKLKTPQPRPSVACFLVGKPNKTRIHAFAELRGFIVDELRLSRADARIIIGMWVSEIQQEEAEENAYEEVGQGWDAEGSAFVAPAPAPETEVSPPVLTPVSFVSVPSTYQGECGVRDGRLYIPLCRMGLIGKDALLWFPVSSAINYLPLPEKMDMAWLDDIARHLKRIPTADYHAHSFQQNIIRPNIAKIVQDLGGISDKVKTRIERDLCIFLNNWKRHNPEQTFENMVEYDMYLPCRETLLMDVDCEY